MAEIDPQTGPTWEEVRPYFSPNSPLASNPIAEHLALTKAIGEVHGRRGVGAGLVDRGLRLKRWSMEKPSLSAVDWSHRIHYITIGGALLVTGLAGYDAAMHLLHQLPEAYTAWQNAQLYFPWGKLDWGQLLPSFTHTPDPTAAFKPVEAAHDLAVQQATAGLEKEALDTALLGAGTLGGIYMTQKHARLNPNRRLLQNSTTVGPFIARILEGMGRRLQ